MIVDAVPLVCHYIWWCSAFVSALLCDVHAHKPEVPCSVLNICRRITTTKENYQRRTTGILYERSLDNQYSRKGGGSLFDLLFGYSPERGDGPLSRLSAIVHFNDLSTASSFAILSKRHGSLGKLATSCLFYSATALGQRHSSYPYPVHLAREVSLRSLESPGISASPNVNHRSGM